MSHGRRISVIGLGYVGLPVAVAFGRLGPVVGFDINARRIEELGRHLDRSGEVSAEELQASRLILTDESTALTGADFHIVTVPTPIDGANRPDFGPLLAASRTVGARLKPGDIVVYESTVYPGATEHECVPVLERASGLRYGTDFTVGYSPERINPGDHEHRFETIVKVVSASDAATLEVVARVYASVVTAGIHRAPNIATAEAAKVIENTQRDLNIALMNELALIFQRLGLDSADVLAAAGTKWNFLKFAPGLVGGHCIGVDPYYLTHRAEQLGYHPEVILAGRRINDGMGQHLARETVKALLRHGGAQGQPVVTILGVTFKEDVPDVRNTRVVDIARELATFGIRVQVHDPIADPAEVAHEYGIALTALPDLVPADAVIVAVRHAEFRRRGWGLVEPLLTPRVRLVVDVKGCLDRAACPDNLVLLRL